MVDVDELERRLRAVGTPERVAGTRRYLKSELDFLGATVGQIRAEVKAFAIAHPELSHSQLVTVVQSLPRRRGDVHRRQRTCRAAPSVGVLVAARALRASAPPSSPHSR